MGHHMKGVFYSLLEYGSGYRLMSYHMEGLFYGLLENVPRSTLTNDFTRGQLI